MNKLYIISGLLFVIVLAGGLYFISRTPTVPKLGTDTKTITQTTVSPTSQNSSNSSLAAGGSSLLDPKKVFTVLYPSDYQVDTSDVEHPRIFKRGETQRPQTELYDGVLIVFESVDLNGKTLSAWIDDRINDATQNGMQELVKPKTATTINNYPGYSYILRGLGESTYTVIQKDTNSKNAVVMSTLVADPNNKGYQQEVNNTLNSITLLK